MITQNGCGILMIRIIRAFVPFFMFGIMCRAGNIIFIFFLVTQIYRFSIVTYISRDIVMFAWKLFLVMIKYFKWINYPKINIDIKDKGCLIIANHPSLLDVVFLIAHLRHCNCVVKKELKRNIFLYPAIKCSRYITNEFNEEFLNKCINVLQQKENLIIFPEGTRTVDRINMHKGASYIAVYGAEKIIPFYITIEPKCLGKYDKWYNLPENINYNVIPLEEICLSNFEKNVAASLRVRHLHSFIKSIYENYNKL